MIDETKNRIPIWLIWVTSASGLTSLATVTLTQLRTSEYCKIIIQDSQVIKTNIEISEANYLFNPDWDTVWQSAYGKDHLDSLIKETKSVQQQVITVLECELSEALNALELAGQRIKALETKIVNS